MAISSLLLHRHSASIFSQDQQLRAASASLLRDSRGAPAGRSHVESNDGSIAIAIPAASAIAPKYWDELRPTLAWRYRWLDFLNFLATLLFTMDEVAAVLALYGGYDENAQYSVWCELGSAIFWLLAAIFIVFDFDPVRFPFMGLWSRPAPDGAAAEAASASVRLVEELEERIQRCVAQEMSGLQKRVSELELRTPLARVSALSSELRSLAAVREERSTAQEPSLSMIALVAVDARLLVLEQLLAEVSTRVDRHDALETKDVAPALQSLQEDAKGTQVVKGSPQDDSITPRRLSSVESMVPLLSGRMIHLEGVVAKLVEHMRSSEEFSNSFREQLPAAMQPAVYERLEDLRRSVASPGSTAAASREESSEKDT